MCIRDRFYGISIGDTFPDRGLAVLAFQLLFITATQQRVLFVSVYSETLLQRVEMRQEISCGVLRKRLECELLVRSKVTAVSYTHLDVYKRQVLWYDQ